MEIKINEAVIFTDGSSRGNPGPGGWGAVVVYNDGELKAAELGGRENHTTNNRMELQAAISALSFLKSTNLNLSTVIYCDSSYVINGITKWVFGWKKNNWITSTKTPVENRDLWEKLVDVTSERKILWKQVSGHVGVVGNERCDEIATAFADSENPALYSGTFEKYEIKNILDLMENHEAVATKSSTRNHSKAKAYSYVSKVGGKILTHRTWAECEARVRGASGAKFKKAVSAEQERKIIAGWSNE
jgi:ribonuclease HI